MIRWLGFILIVSGSSAAGLVMANKIKGEIAVYRAARGALSYIRSEIEYFLTPLEQILEHLALETSKPLACVFGSISKMRSEAPGISMGILAKRSMNELSAPLPKELESILCDTFTLLGKQDIFAQTRAIDAAVRRIDQELTAISAEKTERVRTCRTIGICAGLAVAILLI